MKIFGFEIKKQPKVEIIQDVVPEVKTSVPKIKKPALMPFVKDPTLRYNAVKAVGRGHFQSPEYDLSEVGRIEDTDGYVRQAFDKKIALMFKEGWDITGPDPKSIKYVKARLAQISRASQIPTLMLFRQVGTGLIKKSNAFLIKIRKTEASGGRLRKESGKNIFIKPTAAYFVAPPETMEYQLSGNKIVQWQQRMPNGDRKSYSPRDVIHFFYDRKEGFVFGTPTITPVVDDIRALRKIEENIELLVYQHLFPLFQYIVGTDDLPATFDENGEHEVDVVRREIQYMPTEGGIVTPERHEIKAIGAEGRAIRAEGYLEHFKKRVFAGLGVSAVDMGEGETANRATADNMSRNLIDSVKDFQQIIEIFINEFILGELLLESTFGPSVLDEDRRCYLKFKEIDVDAQIKKEAHHADQFAKDLITWDEARTKTGYEPILVPTREEIDSEQDTAKKYPEWHKTRWKLFEEPKLLIQALDEPWSPAAKAVARSASLETTGGDIAEAGEEAKNKEKELEQEKTKGKIAVEKAKPKQFARPSRPKVKNGYLANTFIEVKKDVVKRVSSEEKIDHDWIGALIRAQMTPTIDRLVAEQVVSFRKGYAVHAKPEGDIFIRRMAIARTLLRDRAERYIVRLTENIIGSLQRNVDNNDEPVEIKTKTRAVFDALQYRTKFIEDVEVGKAWSFGLLTGGRTQEDADAELKVYSIASQDESCENCAARSGQLMSPPFVTLEDIPPYHANCRCTFNVEFIDTSVSTRDATIEEPEPDDVPKKDYSACPKCGKTAMRTKNTVDQYNCKACGHVFKRIKDDIPEELEKAEDGKLKKPRKVGPQGKRYKFTKCVMRSMARMRARHPEWDEDKLEMLAEAGCEHFLQDSIEEEIT